MMQDISCPLLRRLVSNLESGIRHVQTVSIDSACVAVRTNSPSVEAVIRSLFSHYCSVSDCASQGEWTVTVLTDQPRATISDIISVIVTDPSSHQQVKRWKGDYEADRWDVPGFTVVAHTQPFEGATVLDLDKKEITSLLVSPNCNVPHTEHVIKYPLRMQLRMQGYVEVHGASCFINDIGVLLMGYRRSGKTTLLMNLLSQGGLLVANDLSLLTPYQSDAKLELVAIPHMSRLAFGTIASDSILSSRLLESSNVGIDYLHGPVYSGGKFEIYYEALCEVYGRKLLLHRCKCDAVLLPDFNLKQKAAHLVQLDESEARQIVFDRLRNDPPLPDWLPLYQRDELMCRLSRSLEDYSKGLPPVYSIRFGPSSIGEAGNLVSSIPHHDPVIR